MFKHKDQRVGVFIDTQNMYYSARHLFQRKVNFKSIVEDAVAGRLLIRALAYVVKTKTADEQPFFDALQKSGIETREKDLMEYASGHKKADWDVGLAIDVVHMLDILDVVVIVSGDGDYLPLVEHIQSRGRIAEVMAFGETTSSNLVNYVDDYIDLSQNKKRYLIGPIVKSDGKDEMGEEKEEDEEDDFFIEPPKNDQGDSRTRRLEF
ncbi:NYN domain-containing protein [Candidatus Uhrbacteria bacterium]|nr:NYN domain-containing protein [Candidatus Uhrbacteria bacterium]